MRRSDGRWMVLAGLVTLAGHGCGDDDGPSGTADAGGDAGPAISDGGAIDGGAIDGGAIDGGVTEGCTPGSLLVTATSADFTASTVGVLDLTSGEVAVDDVIDDTDTVPALAGCTPLLLERASGNVRVQSTEDLFRTLRTVDVDPAGSSDPYASNPQAVVAVDDGKAYVVASALNEVLVVDLALEGAAAVTGSIDLSGLLHPDDPDGLVDAVDAIRVGDRVFVALGRYWFDESWAMHFGGSLLAVIDATTDTLIDADDGTEGVQGIALAGNNPWRGLWADEEGERLWVGATGHSFAIDGAIEEVDLGTLTSVGPVIDEATVGAEIQGFAVASPGRLLLLAGGAVIAFDPRVAFPETPAEIVTGVDGMILHGGELFTWARAGDDAGLRRFAAGSGAETTPAGGPWDFGMPIYGVAAVP